MQQERMRQARARLALQVTAHQCLFDPSLNVNLVDYGIPIRTSQADDRPTIRFHVDKKLSPFELESAGLSMVPRQIGEFTTDVIEGHYRPHSWPWWTPPAPPPNSPKARFDPLRGGTSISDVFHTAAGTLGGLVRDRVTSADMILSNWHVLVVEWTARPGQRICQPGQLDGGNVLSTVATLTRDAMSVNLDAAVATLTGARNLVNDQLGLGAVTGVATAQIGMRVTKAGRTTLVTNGIVTGVDGIAKLTYGPIQRVIRKVLTIVPSNPFQQASGAGDSGSWWLNSATQEVVALHFAGSDLPERALAIDMQPVLDALNVDVVTDRPPATVRPSVRSQVVAGFSPSAAATTVLAPQPVAPTERELVSR